MVCGGVPIRRRSRPNFASKPAFVPCYADLAAALGPINLYGLQEFGLLKGKPRSGGSKRWPGSM